MSMQKAIIATCDECGNDETFVEGDITGIDGLAPTIPQVRAHLKALGDRAWRTGLEGSWEQPSLYSTRVDLCHYCPQLVTREKPA